MSCPSLLNNGDNCIQIKHKKCKFLGYAHTLGITFAFPCGNLRCELALLVQPTLQTLALHNANPLWFLTKVREVA
jgi:hypothetical protein